MHLWLSPLSNEGVRVEIGEQWRHRSFVLKFIRDQFGGGSSFHAPTDILSEILSNLRGPLETPAFGYI